MLYSTSIYVENDKVPAIAFRIGEFELAAGTGRGTAAELRRLAAYWNSKLELPCKKSVKYDARFQPYIKTPKLEWAPVDHIIWGSPTGETVRMDFTGFGYFVSTKRADTPTRFKRLARGLRALASAISRQAAQSERARNQHLHEPLKPEQKQ